MSIKLVETALSIGKVEYTDSSTNIFISGLTRISELELLLYNTKAVRFDAYKERVTKENILTNTDNTYDVFFVGRSSFRRSIPVWA